MSSRTNDQLNNDSNLKSNIHSKISSANVDVIIKNRKNPGSSSKSSKNNKFPAV